jgi:SAM-dependent methyltransferase
MSDHDKKYFEYLARRSRLGRFYREHWLYPRLCRELHGRVLDVGCGIGDLLRYRPGTLGVDVNRETVAACRAAGLDARPMEPDLLPFDNTSFDGVVLDNVLEHLVSPQPLLAEMARVLKPRGRLLVGVPGTRGYASDSDHKVFYDADAMKATVEAGGSFRRVGLFSTPLSLDWLDSRMRTFCRYGVFERRDGTSPGRAA